ncbi:MAG: DUF3126 family protein [Rhodobiaceae bacterium]|jgi:hypothetical protein|nr:DUF3126 family protein [Rhodobiaceae bacterium]MBT5517642.1 DUF3126 family protein [Rhodobiaceae bacterium]MBT7279264.1 DUF3126 family protein [Rhodobiaceae bacterium]MDG2496052.1 DUF3126 family protein [Alphaproteobacteria bacterium]
MTSDEMNRVQSYLRSKFENDAVTLKRGGKEDMVEVFLGDEFIGTMFRDEDEGEVSYDFNMAILEFDLPTA